MGPRNGCGWHGVIAAVEQLVEDLLAEGNHEPEALRVQGPDPRRPSDRTGCIHVRIEHPALLEHPSLRARLEAVVTEWEFQILGDDSSGFWLGHETAPPTREAPRSDAPAPRLAVVRRAADGDVSGS